MAQSSKVQLNESTKIIWEFSEWAKSHKALVASQSSCTVNLKKPKVALRFFLQPFESGLTFSGHGVKASWYALFAEVIGSPQNTNASVVLTAKLDPGNISKDGVIILTKRKGTAVQVIEEFIHLETWQLDTYGRKSSIVVNSPFLNATNLTITLTLDIFHLVVTKNGDNATSGDAGGGDHLLAEAEVSLLKDLKDMFVCDDNFSDLKLETRDSMTLSAHKFQLAARSPYLRKMIADAMKKDDFNGTLKIEVNGKAMTAILYWMYTGELHENAGRVMEEIVDASIMLELTPLLKVLDKKLITICNQENMFRLFQVAKKNAMPTASDDISAYIRENI